MVPSAPARSRQSEDRRTCELTAIRRGNEEIGGRCEAKWEGLTVIGSQTERRVKVGVASDGGNSGQDLGEWRSRLIALQKNK